MDEPDFIALFDELGDEDELDDEGYQLLEGLQTFPQKGGRRRLILLLALVVVALVAVALVATLGVGGRSEPVPPATLKAAHPDALTKLAEALADAGFQDASADFRASAEGTALYGVFCWDRAGGWPAATGQAMGIVTARASPLQDARITAVGVELARCGSDDVLFWAIAPLDRAIGYYTHGDTTEAEFRETWVTGP